MNSSTVTGPGDDCAVLDLDVPGSWLLLKTDTVVEGIHFLKDADTERVGHKALGRCLSDIAAMAGTPVAALITLGLPEDFVPARIKLLYTGIDALASRYDVAVVGGETVRCAKQLFVSVSVLGKVDPAKCIKRSGALPGDAIFVTGELGGSINGKHLDFEPRLTEAQWLTANFRIHSMIDLSDGLAGDLRHLLRPDNLGAELIDDAIPISAAARAAARSNPNARPPLQAALTDGEDFELLFTLAPEDAVALSDSWKKRFPKLPLHIIGRIINKPGIKMRSRRGVKDYNEKGYTHFA